MHLCDEYNQVASVHVTILPWVCSKDSVYFLMSSKNALEPTWYEQNLKMNK